MYLFVRLFEMFEMAMTLEAHHHHHHDDDDDHHHGEISLCSLVLFLVVFNRTLSIYDHTTRVFIDNERGGAFIHSRRAFPPIPHSPHSLTLRVLSRCISDCCVLD